MGETPGNGNTLRWRVEQLEKRQDSHEEATKWLADAGSRNNEQLNTLRDDVHDMKPEVAKVAVIEDRQTTVLQALNRARTAGWAAAGSLLVLAAAVITQGPS